MSRLRQRLDRLVTKTQAGDRRLVVVWHDDALPPDLAETDQVIRVVYAPCAICDDQEHRHG